MFKTNFKISLRVFRKDLQFTIVNLIGLSTGLACTFLIYLWVADEMNFDKFHEKDSRLYQVMVKDQNDKGSLAIPQTPAPLAAALKKEMPEVEYASPAIYTVGLKKVTLSINENVLKAVGLYVGQDYLNMFSWKMLQGNKDHSLDNKNSIVLTKDLATKLFGTTQNVLGKTVLWQHDKQFMVSGIIDDIPANSSVQFDFLLPFDVFLDANPDEKFWRNSDPSTYVVLRPGTDPALFNKKISSFIQTKLKTAKTVLEARLFSSGYLYGNYENGVQSGGRIEYVRLFSVIALFVLTIACINFMNLSTAKAARRVKEVGVRKVVGASRSALIFQYLTESVLMAFLAMILAIVLLIFLLPPFNAITGKDLSLRFDMHVILPVLLITLLTGLISGSYPALYLSGFNPVTILKGKFKSSLVELLIRRGLVIFQFTLSVLFIISAIVVYRQIQFIQAKNQGFNKDNVISFNVEGLNQDNMTAFLSGVRAFIAEIKDIPGVVNASSMDHSSIIADYGNTGDIIWAGKTPDQNIQFSNIGVNYDMIETLGMHIAQGRSFSRKLSSDSNEIIFNQTAIDQMHLKDPIGKKVKMWGVDRTIVGVVENFHYESMHESVKPFAFRLEPLLTYCIMARIQPGKETAVLDRIQDRFHVYSPGFAFEYKFLDEDYQAQYVAEKRVSVLSRYFTGLVILISCLGLFGLATFTAQKRRKEISVRKVIGATSGNIIVMLSKDFLKLILIAIVVAFPIAWWAMNNWLNSFAYRVGIGVDIFFIAAMSVLFITVLTIGTQALKASLANPVSGLRSE
jgi:putative ABC transport system permease protein